MRRVYAVSSGAYGDYGIDAIFSTREKAEDYMKMVPSDYYNDIEEYEVNPPSAALIKRGYKVWSVFMQRDGCVENVIERDAGYWTGGKIRNEIITSVWKEDKGALIPNVLISDVWAKNEKWAIKIVNERRIQMIAEGR